VNAARVHLATALVRREDSVLLVASRYSNQSVPLWNMPGGRQQPGELISRTVVRELHEETGLSGTIRELAYVSESYDGPVLFTNFTFAVDAAGDVRDAVPENDHVASIAWVRLDQIAALISVRVVREPLLAYLRSGLRGYAGYAEAGITIEFPDASH
jgi:ADP-ribose pyrophosphatase YjhB (NUDIX family)